MLNTSSKTLPEPDLAAKQQSKQLTRCIKKACEKQQGEISFSQYMNMALYQPALGYYSTGSQKFGEKGDFITAPEVSSFFGQCLAKQILQITTEFKKNKSQQTVLLEFGAGSGKLAVDILTQLKKVNALPPQYLIIELSAVLQQRQKSFIKKKLPDLVSRVRWLNELPKEMDNVIVIANEVLDAMPVECFRKDETGEIQSLRISVENGKLVNQYKKASHDTADKIKQISKRSEINFATDYRSEYNPQVGAWLAALAEQTTHIVILLIDYGYNEVEYYSEQRTNGSLLCYYQHHAHDDFFWWPGLQDITAFVNFTDVAYSAVALNLEVAGYTTQAAFLLANGLAELHEEKVSDEVSEQIKLSQQIKTLTLPSEMGERFKVLALTKNYSAALQGFSMLDLRGRL